MTLKPGAHMEASARINSVYEQAASVSINPETHPKFYLKSGRELIRSAASYQEDGQTENAYILYIRFLTIFLQKLRQHPNYKDVSAAERKLMSEYCNKILPQAEFLKKELLQKYEKDHEEYLVQLQELQKAAEERRQKELEEAKKLEAERIRQDKINGPSGTSRPASASTGISGPGYNNHATSTGAFIPSAFGLATKPGVPVPGGYVDNLAEYPKYIDGYPAPSAPPPEPTTSTATPSIDRTTKPNRFMNPIEMEMRSLVVPQDLPSIFLTYVQQNTSKNIEACGLLTGKISGNRLLITDLIIPKQTGTSDTCNMLDESEIVSVQDKHNLITVGWIHTHPSQTAFLSSIDMHTHYSYQIMMPEAIAIVCAPKHIQTGIFSLTPDGMDEIGSCRQQGFHPHKSTGLFSEASHYTLDSSIKVRIHDLR